MQSGELIGDSFAHREAYRNRDVNVTIAYGATRPVGPNQDGQRTTSCVTPQYLLEESTYHESVVEIDGKKAKLGINRHNQPEFILASLCFLNLADDSQPLVLLAQCKDDGALEVAQQIFKSIRFIDPD